MDRIRKYGIKRFTLIPLNEQYISANIYDNGVFIGSIKVGEELIVELLNELNDENKQLKQFIKELTTKGTGRIDLASGYSYNVSAVLTDYRSDVE